MNDRLPSTKIKFVMTGGCAFLVVGVLLLSGCSREPDTSLESEPSLWESIREKFSFGGSDNKPVNSSNQKSQSDTSTEDALNSKLKEEKELTDLGNGNQYEPTEVNIWCVDSKGIMEIPKRDCLEIEGNIFPTQTQAEAGFEHWHKAKLSPDKVSPEGDSLSHPAKAISENSKATATKNYGTQDAGLWIVTLALALLSLVLIGLVVWLYLWRTRIRSLVDEQGRELGGSYVAVVPENWEAANRTQSKNLETQTERLEKVGTAFNQLVTHSKSLDDRIEKMTQTFMTLKDALDEKDHEIKRLKKGYDFSIYENYLIRFIRIGDQIDEYLDDGTINIHELQLIKNILEDAIDDAGVETIPIELGGHYSSVEGVADNPGLIATDDQDQDRRIASVERPGYRHREGTVIREAKVIIYSYHTNDRLIEDK